MQGHSEVCEFLRKAIASELTAVLQYTNDYKEMENQGFPKLAEYIKATADEELEHLTIELARLKFLQGDSDILPDGQVVRSSDIRSIIAHQLMLEFNAVQLYVPAVNTCRPVDPTSEDLFKEILADEEKHIHWLEKQQNIIEKIGVDNYLAAFV